MRTSYTDYSEMFFKPAEDLTFTDDFMFGAVMKNERICRGVLERLLRMKLGKIEYPELQKSISPFYESKGIRLDVYAADKSRVFDIEMQTYAPPDLGKRARYYQSMMDADSLLKGRSYSELKESFVIFICLTDPFKFGLPAYTFKNFCEENPAAALNDKSYKVFYNASAYGKEPDEELRALLRYISRKQTGSLFTDEINGLVEQVKRNETFRSDYLAMNLREYDLRRMGREEGMRTGIAIGEQRGIQEGIETNKLDNARNMLADNISLERIARYTGLPLDTVRKLKEELSSTQ
ncbi:MAG: Rpn family recombination-promoting nuclease/putative transposase [Treponema sp.]